LSLKIDSLSAERLLHCLFRLKLTSGSEVFFEMRPGMPISTTESSFHMTKEKDDRMCQELKEHAVMSQTCLIDPT